MVQEVGEGRRQGRHDDDRPRLEDHVEDLGRGALRVGKLRRDREQLRRRPEERVEVGREVRAALRPRRPWPGRRPRGRARPRPRRAPRCGCESAAARRPSRARCARRGRLSGAIARGSSPSRVTAPRTRLAARAEVPGEGRAGALAGSAERDADAEVLVAAVEEDRPVPGRGQPRAHDRRPASRGRRCPRRSSRPSPTSRRRRSSRRDRCAPSGSSPWASRARRSRCGPCRGCGRSAALRERARGSQRSEPVLAARLVDEAHGRADGAFERRGEGRLREPAQADAAAAGTSEHATVAATMHRVRCRAMGGGGLTVADDALIRSDPRILPDLRTAGNALGAHRPRGDLLPHW